MLIGGVTPVQDILSGDLYKVIEIATQTSLHDMTSSIGYMSIASSLLYRQLPFPFFPVWIPLIGRVDLLLSRVVLVAGTLLVIISWLGY
jgi:hypothetical protein